MLVLDFETEAIEGNTSYNPPKPVGLAYRTKAGETGYLTDWEIMSNFLKRNWAEDLCFHNAKFDVSVARKWFELPEPEPLKIHDTQFLLFLQDPHAASLSLKPSAERVLGLKPEEQDNVRDWILRNVPGAKKSNFGAFIARAPVELVRPYAIGDVVRTHALFENLFPIVSQGGMLAAYQREQKLSPILVDAEKRGLRVDLEKLDAMIISSEATLLLADTEIRKLLNAPSLNPDSPGELVAALEAADAMSVWTFTEKGAKSVAKGALRAGLRNPHLRALLTYRGGLSTCLSTFARPWRVQAQAENGRLHPNWNQVRNSEGPGAFRGTRTGRLSCDHPNLTNPPNDVVDAKDLPEGFPRIPLMRSFLLPEDGHLWVKRDFSSQEIRILAHYEDAALMRAYQNNPELDPHAMAQDLIRGITGVTLPRKDVKIIAFSTLYGAGVSGLAQQLNCEPARAKEVREAYMAAIPGIRELSAGLRSRGRQNLPMKTWGGRKYLPEPPRVIGGVMRSFEYKMLNYLIQGSAADQTKEALIAWREGSPKEHLFLAALHDEINLSVPKDMWQNGMRLLRETMDADRFDVPFKSEGFVGLNFGELNAVVA